MANKPGEANFFPDVQQFPSMGTFQPVYGKFDLTTYIQGASDYEIMAFLVGKYNACLEAYGNITKLSTDTITACKQLQYWINSWFDNLDVQEELNNKIDSMVADGSFGTLLHQTFDTQINQQTTNAVTAWLVANVTPTGSAVVVDKSLSIEGAAADAKVTGDNINSLKEDYSFFKNTSGYVLKPLKSIHKESIPAGTFLDIGNAISGHRYAIVYTPIFATPVSIGVMDEKSNLHDVIDGQTYYSTITASVSGVIRFITQSDIDTTVNIFVYDTTGNDIIKDFVEKALLLVTELKFDYNGRQTITIKSSDNEALNVVRLTGACNVGNIDVCFDGGNYNFSGWYNYVFYMNNRNAFRCEIPIGNGCNYYFNGSTINGTVNDNILQSPLIKTNCSLFGSRTNKGDYMLINGVITATGTIYTIHDEMSGQSKYNHGYENMVINYVSGTQKEVIRKCIGGGAGRYGNVVLKNCILNSDYSHELSFHGYKNVLGNVDGTITLNVSDCYFGHGIQVDTLPTKEIGTVITTCNSFRSDYADYGNSNWTKYSWNNVAR